MRTKIWKTKTGQKIRIMDMESSHIANCINLLLRAAAKHQSETLSYYPSFQGEMAQMFAEQEWDALSKTSVEDFAMQLYPIIDDLLQELKDRKHNRVTKGNFKYPKALKPKLP